MLYRFAHKTGVYVVEVVENQENQCLVKVLQVIKHPKQGDLHHPNEVEGVFFHERKALSLYEKRLTSQSRLSPFDGEIEDYTVTLQRALTALENQLKAMDTPYAHASLDCLEQLKKDYASQYRTNFL
ncbi:sporulation phosphorelay system protein KapB [Staphylococcus lutrae]|uniref:Kinase n=1 Tax=Staphylococcus lutrae TaxID=155085 RepID=A0AAC9WMR3_9STAP|nr:sporulation phosphorelay system protein KapB [Staphylococcus lutrae]ARJ51392.1 kinase [Staphylococcus lutrae]PNZ37027.1 kinase [Staphylococcus lutrae]